MLRLCSLHGIIQLAKATLRAVLYLPLEASATDCYSIFFLRVAVSVATLLCFVTRCFLGWIEAIVMIIVMGIFFYGHDVPCLFIGEYTLSLCIDFGGLLACRLLAPC